MDKIPGASKLLFLWRFPVLYLVAPFPRPVSLPVDATQKVAVPRGAVARQGGSCALAQER